MQTMQVQQQILLKAHETKLSKPKQRALGILLRIQEYNASSNTSTFGRDHKVTDLKEQILSILKRHREEYNICKDIERLFNFQHVLLILIMQFWSLCQAWLIESVKMCMMRSDYTSCKSIDIWTTSSHKWQNLSWLTNLSKFQIDHCWLCHLVKISCFACY